MARIRTIKPQFWLDQRLADNLTRDQRLFYIGLWNQADDEGRFVANPRLLLGVIFPYDSDLNEGFVDEALGALSRHGRIVLYSHEGEHYGEISKWSRHQRINHPSASAIPSSDNDLSTITGSLPEASRSLTVGKGKGRGREKENHMSDDMRAFTYPDEFEIVWALHHRGPKRKAFDAYRKAVSNGITHDGLLLALKAYRRSLRDDFLGAHLFRWIRDERWQEVDDDDGGSGVTVLPNGLEIVQ